ncbi:chaplin [Streptomyces sp. NPDC005859]|uniref:chaplin n=1 Tax=Streptomyces sp. NPDC005859 TaxID=3157170 RepID=UPI0033D35593
MRQVTRKSLMTVAAATGVIAAAGGYAHADSGAHGAATDSPGVLSGNSVQAPINVPVNICGNTIDVIGALNPAFGNSCANKGGGAQSGGYGDHRGGGAQSGGYGDHRGGGAQSGGYGDHQGGGGRGGNHGGSQGGNQGGGHGGSGAYGGSGGAYAGGYTGGSPGVGSGNHVQAPIDVPVNVCGNGIDVVGILNPSFGNDCANDSGPEAHTPPSRGHETPGKPSGHGPGKPGGHASSPSRPGGVPSTSDHVTPAGASAVHRPAAQAPQLAHTGSGLPVGLALPAGAGALLAGAVLYRKARASA